MQSYIDHAGQYGIPGNTLFVKNFMGYSAKSFDQDGFKSIYSLNREGVKWKKKKKKKHYLSY